jgi:hypothetical protein
MDVWSLSLVNHFKVPIVHILALESWILSCFKYVRYFHENDKYEYTIIVYQYDML